MPGVPDLQLDETTVPTLLKDPPYLFLPWLMRIYTSQLDPHQAHFNGFLGQTCPLVECVFGCLEGRWHILTTHLKDAEANIPQVIITACVLHNICEAQHSFFSCLVTKKLSIVPLNGLKPPWGSGRISSARKAKIRGIKVIV
ncbi:hypothetical protein Y1Q_0021425 [Alligator mississippiensis]|uniref:DDE Tnp4 domain-containing protein n=1 Tax=Alligator mississippiensis TaxID=8496 RepID=A0A151P9L9_ALLMI|nr:hypothetical protein Y1Q_0021425 [Alligator mississippiensis]